MRKVLVLLVMIGLLLGVLPAAATPVADLTSLAQYFPLDTVVFGAARTDAGYVETLDALVARIAAAVPGAGVPGRLSTMLDLAAQQIDAEGDFESVFRSWLGDTAAFGLLELPTDGSDNPPFVIAIAVTDREKADDFADKFLREMGADFSVTTEGAFTLYEVDNRNVAVAVTDDALFLAESRDVLRQLNTREARLNTNSSFTDATGALPMSDYDIVLYLDTPVIMNSMVEMNAFDTDSDGATQGEINDFVNVTGPQAFGIVLVNGSDLVFDSAQLMGDASGLEELGFVLPTNLPPVNLDFAAHIPADSPFVILGSDLAQTYDLLIENLRAAQALQPELSQEGGVEDFEQGLRFLQIGIRGLTGLDLREDILGWMTGGYGLFFNINPAALDDPTSVMPLDFGLVVEATDPEAAQAVVEGIREAMTQAEPKDFTLSQETVAGVDAAVISGQPEDSEYPVEFLVGANDDVFVIGTRNAFTGVFEGDGGLAADPTFNAASNLFLDNSAFVFYFSPQPLKSLAEAMAASDEQDMQEGAGFIQVLSGLVSSGSIGGAWSGDGTHGRFVLSLAE